MTVFTIQAFPMYNCIVLTAAGYDPKRRSARVPFLCSPPLPAPPPRSQGTQLFPAPVWPKTKLSGPKGPARTLSMVPTRSSTVADRLGGRKRMKKESDVQISWVTSGPTILYYICKTCGAPTSCFFFEKCMATRAQFLQNDWLTCSQNSFYQNVSAWLYSREITRNHGNQNKKHWEMVGVVAGHFVVKGVRGPKHILRR